MVIYGDMDEHVKVEMLEQEMAGNGGHGNIRTYYAVGTSFKHEMYKKEAQRKMPEVPGCCLGFSFTRNSFFAKRLLTHGFVLVLVDIFALYFIINNAEVVLASHSNKSLKDCDLWIGFAITVFVTFLPIILLALPATGIRAFELFKRQTEKRDEEKEKLTTVKRTCYLQFCEVIVAILVLYLFGIFISFLYAFFQHPFFTCHDFRYQLFSLAALTVYIFNFIYITMFTRFREHIKMQLGAYYENQQTGGVLTQVTSKKWFTSNRNHAIRVVRKKLYKAAEQSNNEEIECVLKFANEAIGSNFVDVMYKSNKLFLGLFALSKKNPMHACAGTGNIKGLNMLHEVGFDVNSFDKVDRMRFSTGDLFWYFVHFFVKRPGLAADDKATVMKATLVTPLHCAVATSHVPVVEWLLARNAEVNVRAKSSFRSERVPPLFMAEHAVIVELLLIAGANHMVIPSPGHMNTLTALELAYLRGNSAVCGVLLEWGGDIALSPLHLACGVNNHKKVHRLLKANVSPNCLGEFGYVGVHMRTPLHWAAISGSIDCILLLLKFNADVNFQDHRGRTPLHWAVRVNQADAVRVLLEVGHADPNILDRDFMTPVVCAAHAEKLDKSILKMLTDYGADLNYQIANGDTALHIAIKHEKRDAALALVSCGADIMKTNEAGFRPVDCATSTELQFAIKSAAGHRDVMISYTHSHGEFAQKLRKSLEMNNVTTWLDLMDPSGIGGGSVWREEISKGISNAALVVCILTEDYTKSEWCLKELGLAKQLGTPVLAISTEHVRLNEELQVYLYTRQIVPFEPSITSINNENPRAITYTYDDPKYETQFRMLLDGVRDEIEKKRHDIISRNRAGSTSLDIAGGNLVMSPSFLDHFPSQFLFIAHGDCNLDFVERLYSELTSRNISCYMDQKSPDNEMSSRIHIAKEAMLKCSGVIVLLSSKSCKNEILNDQLAFAEDKGKPLYPVLLSDPHLPPGQKYTLSRNKIFHFAQDLGFVHSLNDLLSSIKQ